LLIAFSGGVPVAPGGLKKGSQATRPQENKCSLRETGRHSPKERGVRATPSSYIPHGEKLKNVT